MRVIAPLVGLLLAFPAAAQSTLPSSGSVSVLPEIVNLPEPPALQAIDAVPGDVPPSGASTGRSTGSPATGQPDRNVAPKELLAKVNELTGRREFDKAIAAITEAIAADGQNAELYRLRASVQCRAARIKLCLEDADKAIEADNAYMPAHVFRGLARIDAGQAKDAVADCETAIRNWSDRPFGYNCRGLARRAMRDFPGAIADFDMANSKDPKFALAPYNKGMTYLLENRPEEAIASFSTAISINQKYDDALAQRGRARMTKGDIANAREDFSKALSLNQGNVIAAIGLQALHVAKALDTLTTKN